MNTYGKHISKESLITVGLFGKFLVAALFLALPGVEAIELNTPITTEEKAQFDEILTPVMKIYGFVKYSASAIGAIALVGAGILFMFSGADIKRREVAKSTAAFAIMGLGVIWSAPYVVNVLAS